MAQGLQPVFQRFSSHNERDLSMVVIHSGLRENVHLSYSWFGLDPGRNILPCICLRLARQLVPVFATSLSLQLLGRGEGGSDKKDLI